MTAKIDPEFEGDGRRRSRAGRKAQEQWAQPEAVVRSEGRLKLIARDLVDHFEKRFEAMDGKAMIVTMSRRLAVALYSEIIALRPQWHNEDDGKGAHKVVMTGSASYPIEWQKHIRSKKATRGPGRSPSRRRRSLQDRDRA